MSTAIEAKRGDTLTLTVDWNVDITGATLYFTVKRTIDDQDSAALVAVSQASHTTPLSGLTSITVPAATMATLSPGKYPADLQMIFANGTVESSELTLQVKADVKRATS